MALTKVSTGVVDMSQDTGGLIIAKGNGTDVSSGGERPACNATILGSIRENTDENKVEVCTANSGTPGWQFLEEAGPSFIPLTVEYLVVAGGGGGGLGGGGAGGYRTSFGTGNINGGNTPVENALTLATGSPGYTVTIGAGGAGIVGNGTQNQSDSGNNSVFSSITSTGGGGAGTGGASGSFNAGVNGGSGGGSHNNYTAGAAVTNPTQGFSGGIGTNATGGGGGGAGGAGNNNTTGGVGLDSLITGTSTPYAGGGGGYPSGAASYGGGAAGGAGTGSSAAANTGAGGGGGVNGGLGGSGVVILRYPSAYAITFQTGVGFISSTATLSATLEKVTTITAGSGTIQFT